MGLLTMCLDWQAFFRGKQRIILCPLLMMSPIETSCDSDIMTDDNRWPERLTYKAPRRPASEFRRNIATISPIISDPPLFTLVVHNNWIKG